MANRLSSGLLVWATGSRTPQHRGGSALAARLVGPVAADQRGNLTDT